MRSGLLRSRGEIQQATRTRNASGDPIASWSKLYDAWADIRAVSASEYEAAKAINASVSNTIEIRYRTGVTPAMLFVFGSRTFDINGAVDPDGRKQKLFLNCTESASNNG